MMRSMAAIFVLGAALVASPFAQAINAQVAPAPIGPAQMAILSKADVLSTATGSELHEAAMAVCLVFSSQPDVLPMLLTEAGWKKDEEMSYEYISTFVPPAGSALDYIELGAEAGYCTVGSETLGGKAAHELSAKLLSDWSGKVETVTEGSGDETCVKYEARTTFPAAGTLYLSVFSMGDEDLSCDVAETHSITTYAFVGD